MRKPKISLSSLKKCSDAWTDPFASVFRYILSAKNKIMKKPISLIQQSNKLLVSSVLTASVANLNAQSLFNGGTELLHSGEASNSASISVFDGEASWESVAGPANSGTFGDGTVVDYAFYNNSNIDPTTRVVTPYAEGSSTAIGDATSPAANTPAANFRDWITLWSTSDPDIGAGAFSTTPDFTTPDNTGLQTALITGTIDLTALTLTSGSVYFIYGSFIDAIEITATLSGPGQPDLVASGGVFDRFFFGDRAGSVITTLNFDTGNGAYDTLTWTQTNTDTDGSRGSFAGLIIDEGITTVLDQDGDGLTDVYEIENGLDENDDGTVGETSPGAKDGPNGALGDPDLDNLSNIQEQNGLNTLGMIHSFGATAANNADTDGDELFDDEEVGGTLNAFQTNVAGDTATTTPGLATNPNNPDSDNDGISDGDEVFGTLNVAFPITSTDPFFINEATNPNNSDTDGDQMTDDYEVANNLLGGLNPNIDDAAGNLDGDTGGEFVPALSNLDEFLGTSLGVQTRADKLDTDDDGYEDWVEDGIGSWFSATATGTSPINPDSDNDGLLDGQENLDLTSFPGAGVLPTNTDPNIVDGDNDGIPDGNEVLNHGSNASLVDSDNDGFDDPAEIFLYATAPLSDTSVPSAAQLAELRVNFQSGNATPPATDLTIPAGFQAYEALHENLATFDDQTYSAFGGTNNITVGLSWDGGAGVAPTAPQLFDRADRIPEWSFFQRGWVGTDERVTPSAPLTVTISGLPSGTYLWTSYHVDMADQSNAFNASVTSASGTSASTNVAPGIDVTAFDDIPTYQEVLTSDGTTPITVAFDSEGDFFYMNGFEVTNTNIPASGNGITITSCEFEASSGDFLISFSPGGPDHILTSSDDLVSLFTEESNAVLENNNTTFRVPANALNSNGRDFFRVEETQ